MKNRLFIFLAFIPGLVNAQNWNLFHSNAEAYFGFDDNSNPFLNPYYEHAVRFDSLSAMGGDSLFYNYLIDDQITESDQDNICGYTHLDTGWLGYAVLQRSNGDYQFLNERADTILIRSRAGVGQRWRMVNLTGGNYLELMLLAANDSLVLGVNDSVKTALIQARDINNNPITHAANGLQIIWGKSLGLLRGVHFLRFPGTMENTDSRDDYQPAFYGNNAGVGIHRPTLFETYAFQPGDTLQVGVRNGWFGTSIEWFYEKAFLSRTENLTGDTLVLEYRYRRYFHQVNWPGPVHNYTFTDTLLTDVLVDHDLEANPFLSGTNLDLMILPNQSFAQNPGISPRGKSLYNAPAPWSWTNEYGGFMRKGGTDWAWWNMQPDSNCFLNFHIDGDGSCTNHFGLIGLGEWFYNCPGMLSEHYELPQYIHLGNHLWGSPLSFDSLHVIGVEDPLSVQMLVFPNPASDEVTFRTLVPETQISIIDALGRQVFQGSVNESGELRITSDQIGAAGIYFWLAIAGSKSSTGKLTLVDL